MASRAAVCPSINVLERRYYLQRQSNELYSALGTNDSAVQVLGDETLRDIARGLVDTVRRNVTIDWTLRENVRANLRRLVRRVLRPGRWAVAVNDQFRIVSRTRKKRLAGAVRAPG